MTPLRGTRRADKFVWYVCIFMMGWIVGVWTTETPKFAACVEIPKKPVMYQSKGDVTYWRNYTKGLPK